MASSRSRIWSTVWPFLLCSLPLLGCTPSAPSQEKLRKDIGFCKSVIDVISANHKLCGPHLAAIKAELAKEKNMSRDARPPAETTGGIASPGSASPKWVNGKMILECNWTQTKKLVIPGSNVDESKTTSGTDEIVLDQLASTVNNEKASFSAESIVWAKDNVENNVAKQETVTINMRRAISRVSLRYSGFDSYKAEGGIGGHS